MILQKPNENVFKYNVVHIINLLMSEEGKNLTDKSLEATTENSLYRLMYLMVRDSNISVIVHALVLVITLM